MTVYTDHKNLVHEASVIMFQSVMMWCLLLEEYGSEMKYVQAKKNIVTDALSRLDSSGWHKSLDNKQECFRPSQSDEHVFSI